jgi:DNA-binding FadR family transcriptional regulator
MEAAAGAGYRLYSAARMQQSMRQHRELPDAMAAGDPASAEAVMRVYISIWVRSLHDPEGFLVCTD